MFRNYSIDQNGRLLVITPEIDEMMAPVECKWCRKIHDSAKVEVLQRYMDCSVWECPNCHKKIDDRHPQWGGSAIPVEI